MDRYTMYCTAGQMKKALELGAPIIGKIGIALIIPSAEEMIGWLDEQGIIVVVRTNYDDYAWEIWKGSLILDMSETETLSSRKEATIAAIDAALEYLESNL